LPRNKRHYRVKLQEVLAAHDFALTFGGLRGIRDLGAIEAAVARPYCGYYRSIAKKVAALVQSLASNHGFIDGNKRTALLMMNLLLLRSGYFSSRRERTADQRRRRSDDSGSCRASHEFRRRGCVARTENCPHWWPIKCGKCPKPAGHCTLNFTPIPCRSAILRCHASWR